MKCPNCKTENPDTRKFCRECGAKLPLMCPQCGNKLGTLNCKKCNSEIKIRQHILTDFLIGACAVHLEGRTIVTSDTGYYSTYFPELNIVTV